MDQLQSATTYNAQKPNPQPPSNSTNGEPLYEDFDSTCSTPYVSAPSSPGRGPHPGFFYSAPASPMHFAITAASSYDKSPSSAPMGYEFEFSARFGSVGSAGSGSMSSADELFLNGQIRPMKLSSHLERPQVLAPLLDLEGEEEEEEAEAVSVSVVRGRDLRLRDKSVRRRTRSMSPLRSNTPLEWAENEDDHIVGGDHDNNVSSGKQMEVSSLEAEKRRENTEDGLSLGLETTPSVSGSASSSRSSSAGRSSKRWVFLKDFLRSKSEGRSNNKFWSSISFSPTAKDKKPTTSTAQTLNVPTNTKSGPSSSEATHKSKGSSTQAWARRMSGKPTNGVGKRRVPPSPHELHYKANRAQAEELRKKTFLPYRQGLLGCLGFSSKGYGAMNGFARALNPVSSR
ncbi:uncharacterized protein LOC124826727 [Vigna umbellata]|uniref:uncharacterized protein LOC124826727 n=1 Tax=Vigna umbellata TaxID=87088 RepID=UPI001F5EA138|nr:uncharacterized protein LOC124826727 [Vigna umbellata]